MVINSAVNQYLNKNTKAATLAAFRVLFGFIMLISLVRFLSHGWVEDFYISPDFHFKYYGFSWVKTLGVYTYILFVIAIVSIINVIIGYKYRLSMITFFVTFTYIELIDKTTYLNHYYFTSSLSLLLCFLPMNATFSLDAFLQNKNHRHVPMWSVDAVKLLLGIVYFYAGLAKLNSDWLLRAQPLKIWLSPKTSLPIIGPFMNDTWFHYTMSWSGMLYDLTIPFLLLIKRTRPFAFLCVVVFHVFTRVLFPIGMFPYIMIICTTIFFDSHVHESFILFLKKIFRFNSTIESKTTPPLSYSKVVLVGIFLLFHLIFPFRHLLYPDELFWSEEGYRYSWRVMLMEKGGYTSLNVYNYDTKKSCIVNDALYLTPYKKKQMMSQPDFILEYAHYIGKQYKQELKTENIGVFASGYISLNGRKAEPFIDPRVDLLKEKESFKHKNWIIPFKDEIKGL